MSRRGLSRLLALFLLLPAPALRAATAVEVLDAPVVAVAPAPAAAAPGLPVPSALAPESAAKPLEADRAIRASLARAVVAEASKLSSLTEHMSYAQASGTRLVLLPFDGAKLPQLSADSLAQAEPSANLVMINWSMAGRDRYALERAGAGAEAAQRLSALSLAPVLGHELRHLSLRAEAGFDFPGLREEEVLTHLDQAEAAGEVLSREQGLAALRPLLERQFVFAHNAALLERWRRGFGDVVDYARAKYHGQPSLSEPEKNAAVASAFVSAWRRAGAPSPYALERMDVAARFWSDPAAVARVARLIQTRVDRAYERYLRLNSRRE